MMSHSCINTVSICLSMLFFCGKPSRQSQGTDAGVAHFELLDTLFGALNATRSVLGKQTLPCGWLRRIAGCRRLAGPKDLPPEAATELGQSDRGRSPPHTSGPKSAMPGSAALDVPGIRETDIWDSGGVALLGRRR